MTKQENPASLWDDSMRIGLDWFDEERKELLTILEHLDVNQLQTISSELFLAKFHIYEAAVRGLFEHEESLFSKYDVPDTIKKRHETEHHRIIKMLNTVYLDSRNKRNQTAIDVYQMIRADMKQHISNFGQELRNHVSPQAYR